jgi:pilus assembly protein CpaB
MGKQALFIIFAAIAAASAALVVHSALKRSEEEVARVQKQMVDIVVANRDMPLGSKIRPDSVKLVRWSRDALPAGSFQNVSTVVGSYVRRSVLANEPLVEAELFRGDKNAGIMSLAIPKGMRAMSVEVDEVSDIAGFVLPHSRVDVLVAVTNAGQAGQKPFSKIVLQDVQVLAVAQEMDRQKDQPEVAKVVTLLVKPDEAERLALASHEGVLRLAMRSYDDHQVVMSGGADLADLRNVYNPAATMVRHRALRRAAIQPAPYRVEIIRDGTNAESAAFIYHQSGHDAAPGNSAWLPVEDNRPSRPVKVLPKTPQPPALAAAPSAVTPAPLPPMANAVDPPAGTNPPLAKTIDVTP